MKYLLIAFVILFCSLTTRRSKAQTAAADNKLSQTITFRPIPKGLDVAGVFQGRPPCDGVAKQLNISVPADCPKLKWDLILYQDPTTQQPTTYALTLVGGGELFKQPDGGAYRQQSLKGKWIITKGARSDANAVVYRLALNTGAHLYLLKGDDNVLFVLDENKAFRVGNIDFSYTLNRVTLVPGNK
ncbi:copper resistance protein NlpE [Chitinophaga agrisoli]|uniref:Copper resistance protein NlpE n=1 Tax=Chitinophaga agrisoli TaxID=2607653 RepID=A0A5B2VMQ5_9BACT|nr:copper resistance protein NlpE [Chitinophaga agrisoli]KAA2240275.1 copper resistance protein NlpE [Chitinophaga agrisoli]